MILVIWINKLLCFFSLQLCFFAVYSDHSLKTRLFQIPTVYSRSFTSLFEYDQGVYDSTSDSGNNFFQASDSENSFFQATSHKSNKKYSSSYAVALASRIAKEYSRCFTLLYQYDSGHVDDAEIDGEPPTERLTMDLAVEVIDYLKQVLFISFSCSL